MAAPVGVIGQGLAVDMDDGEVAIAARAFGHTASQCRFGHGDVGVGAAGTDGVVGLAGLGIVEGAAFRGTLFLHRLERGNDRRRVLGVDAEGPHQ